MRRRRKWMLGATAVVTILLGTLVAIPAWASQSGQVDGPSPDAYTTMHEACGVGDVQEMNEAMDSLDEEDWAAMEKHMGDGHYGEMGSGMMGMDGMMGRWSGSDRGSSDMMTW